MGDLTIIGIKQPETAQILKVVKTPGYACSVDVSGDVAYVADSDHGVQVIDISSPESAHIVKNLATSDNATDIKTKYGYAYITGDGDGIHIADLSIPLDPHIVKTVPNLESASCLDLSGVNANVSRGNLNVVNIETPESAYIDDYIGLPAAMVIDISGSMAYVSSSDVNSGLYVIDITDPEIAHVIHKIDSDIFGWCNDFAIQGGYAYSVRTGGYAWDIGYLNIYDIDPLKSTHLVKTLEFEQMEDAQWARIKVIGQYGYYVDDYYFRIFDIDPPGTAQTVIKWTKEGGYSAIAVSGDAQYAALACNGEIQIVDIDPPKSAHVVKSIDINQNPYNMVFDGEYIYSIGREPVPYYKYNLVIIDVNPYDSAHVVNEIQTQYQYAIGTMGGYVYTTGTNGGTPSVQVYDVDPPESAKLIAGGVTLADGADIAISNGYVYVAGQVGGLSIFKPGQ